MNPSETAFLALGLVLGAAIGAAIVEAVRSRPARRREVRVTVVPNSVSPRRSTTLAEAGAAASREPIPGSPDDTAWPEPVEPPGPVPSSVPAGGDGTAPADVEEVVADGAPAGADSRPEPGPTRVRVPVSAVSVPATAIAVPVGAAGPASAADTTESVARPGVAAPVAVGALAAAETAARPRLPVEDERPGIPATAVAFAVGADRPLDDAPLPAPTMPADDAPLPPPAPPAASPSVPPPAPPAQSAGEPSTDEASTSQLAPAIAADPCAGARTLVDERCAVAVAARERARIASEALREEQRAYDVLRDRVERAQAQADPREIAAAKDALHRAFRQASAAAVSADDTEAAAREWLSQVNDLNNRTRDAARQVEAGGAELRAALPRLERLGVEADAARISAESAELACHEARERLAGCEEALAAAAAAALAPVTAEDEPVVVESGWPTGPGMEPGMPEDTPGSWEPGGLPRVIRILRGDGDARERVAAAMAPGDPEAGRAWQMRIARLVDAITARAVEDGFLDLPDDDPFWGLFTHNERRDIVGALSALGFRYDGLGAFSDGRVPAQRDLSLAVGYAGLDRMRIRVWPREGELAGLYDRATVAADEWLVHEAGDLSMGEMVDALGGRAAELTDAWNAWGRLRPALLAED